MTYIANRPLRPATPLILSAPHGGRDLGENLVAQSHLTPEKLLATSDFWTDRLASISGNLSWIVAKYARVMVDLNRDPDLLDPSVIEGVPRIRDPYVHAGYGVIPRFAERGKLVRAGKISYHDAKDLLQKYHLPYHQKLQELVAKSHEHQGRAVLIDIHTAPAHVMNSADIIIGTDHGRSLKTETLETILQTLTPHFRQIEVDHVFSGGYITKHYANPEQGIETLQIEINRNLTEHQNRDFRQDFLKKWHVVIEQISHQFSGGKDIKTAAE